MVKGIGIDLVEYGRLNEQVKSKVLTSEELVVYEKINSSKYQEQFLASRWALKEAIIKAVPKVTKFSEIETWSDDSGGIKTNIPNLQVSISHERSVSVAVAIWSEN